MEINKDKCCGCGACANICPNNCLIMKPDEEGFIYPVFDEKKCINCNLCEKVCPFENIKTMTCVPKVLAAKSTDDYIRFNSSSGGIFSELAKKVISKGGIVCSAVMADDNRSVIFDFAENVEDLEKFRGSKYIQSDTKDVYKLIKEKLLKNVEILFCGTTCQVAGLKQFLIKDYDNLLCVDLICHGAPSPLMWDKYLDYYEEKYNTKVDKISFRSKKYSWAEFGMNISSKKERFEFSFENPYFRLFNSNLCLRTSCYDCKVKGMNNLSDISLGDFWHIETVIDNFDDGKGVSMVLLNTTKGETFFNSVKSDNSIVVHPTIVSFDDACKCNGAIHKSMNPSANREDFFRDLEKNEFNFIIKKYTPNSYKYVLKAFLIKSGIWNHINKIRGGGTK